MQRLLLAASLIFFLISGTFAQVSEKKDFSYGILYMAEASMTMFACVWQLVMEWPHFYKLAMWFGI